MISYKSIGQEVYRPIRISDDIQFDGRLDEDIWKQVTPLTDFMQTTPTPGAPPTEKTEVRMVYNNFYLYVGFRCYDSFPTQLVRFLMNRDFELGKDDGISVQLDTYNDKSNAVLFVSNSLNGRFDSEVTNNGNSMNNDYNNFWDVISKIDSLGYTCEFKIPFSSLRFQQKDNTIMGFRFARLIKRKNELITYPKCDSSLKNQWNNCSQAATLMFSNLKTKKPVYLTPYIIANFNQDHILNEAGTKYVANNTFFTSKKYVKNDAFDKILSNIGADAKYGITKNFTLNLTLNTDFSQAEVDNRIINLSKYAVNFPEKRSFFLESKNLLSYSIGSGTALFNSRTIGLQNGTIIPIIAGIRFTGKQNGWAIGALNMQTSEVRDLNIPAQNFSVARLRKYYGSNGSFWGGIITNRISTQNSTISNQTLAVDAVHFFNDKWLLGFGAVSTYDSLVTKAIDKNTFFNIFAFKNVNVGFTHSLNFDLVGNKFYPALGFNPENDYGSISISNGRRYKISGNKKITFWSVNSDLHYRWKHLSQLTETKSANISLSLTGNKGSTFEFTPAAYTEDRLFNSWQLNDNITVPSGYYKMYTLYSDLFFDQSKGYTFGLYTKFGGFYGGALTTINPYFDYIVNRYLRVGLKYEYNHIKFPEHFSTIDHSIFNSNLFSLDLSIVKSTKLSVKMLAQYDDQSATFGGNIRVRYNPKEGTDLYIVYNSTFNANRLEAKPILPYIEQQGVIVKYSLTFGL
ncbi:MAG: carbohydrate binding family 9 domain-containing protein [Saprospiraceae bacterium]|nr:carbohydrate binding family 9 domain-containing protein [Saprospiraceae bacterium]